MPSVPTVLALLFPCFRLLSAEEPEYALSDPELQRVTLDSVPAASFLAVRADSSGRLFVGGREALFVYEPDGQGLYRPRREIYTFPNHTWVYDIEIRGDDLYLMTVSALYVIPGAVTRREGLQAKRLVWGVPLGNVHQCFHALAWGPEGDLYFSMGDPLWYYGDLRRRPDHWGHWTMHSQPEGTRTPYTGVGGVFRCRPDGSGLQIVARGLRNPCGLAFDRHWNLFANDNDHEGMPSEYVPSRLLHVTPHAYFAWPRGWMPHKTPGRADLLETLYTGMGRSVPVGMAYYDEAYLPERYRDNLLQARWCVRSVVRYPLEPRGASFRADEHTLLAGLERRGRIAQPRPVGVSVGRGGRIFATVAYMGGNEESPTYKSDLVMITRADDPEAHPFDGYAATEAAPEKLWVELSDPSWGRRRLAHVEILRRGGPLLVEAVRRLAAVEAGDPALHSLVWLAAASGAPAAGERLRTLAGHADPLVRVQTLRALAEFSALGAPRELFVHALADGHPQVRHAAVLAFFGSDGDPPEDIDGGPARSEDTYLRQVSALLLAEKAPFDRLAALCRAGDAPGRMAGVLAAGFRLTLPPATQPVPDRLPLEPFRGERPYVIPFIDARIDLREGCRIGNFTQADLWKVAERAGEPERLFALLLERLSDPDERIRLQAAHFLSLLDDPRSEPEIAKVRAESARRKMEAAPGRPIGRVWLVGPFADDPDFRPRHPPEKWPMDLAARYGQPGFEKVWKEVVSPDGHYDLRDMAGPCDRSSFYACVRLESAGRERAQLLLGSDDGVKVWLDGREAWSNDAVRAARPSEDAVTLDLQPGGNTLLIRIWNQEGGCGMWLHTRTAGRVEAVLPEKPGKGSLADRLKAAAAGAGAVAPGPEFLDRDWSKAAEEGDAENGRRLFTALGCAACHGASADAASPGAPSLAEAGKRFTVPYLVESILFPDRQVSPVFRASRIATADERVLIGLVVGETAERVELLMPDATRKTVPAGDIASRALLDTSPMPQGVVRTPEELRDLLGYLLKGSP